MNIDKSHLHSDAHTELIYDSQLFPLRDRKMLFCALLYLLCNVSILALKQSKVKLFKNESFHPSLNKKNFQHAKRFFFFARGQFAFICIIIGQL